MLKVTNVLTFIFFSYLIFMILFLNCEPFHFKLCPRNKFQTLYSIYFLMLSFLPLNFHHVTAFFRHQAVYSMDCPRTVLIDFLHEDGKFLFRADGVPDLEVHEDDLEMTAENTVVCRLLDNDIKCVAPGRRYDEWFSNFLKGMLPHHLGANLTKLSFFRFSDFRC